MAYAQTQTQSKAGYKAGVQDYKLTYYTPDYTPKIQMFWRLSG
jgi:hypothetical protein